MIGSPVFGWALENLLWASAAMLLVLAIRRPVTAMLGAGTAYALWLVPLLRLIAPPADWFTALGAPLPSLVPLIVTTGGTDAASPPLAGPGQWAPILIAVWAGGALLFLALQAIRYRMFLARLAPMAEAGMCAGVRLVQSEAAEGPLALGLVRRRIVVPADFIARYTAEEQRLALAHERHHHQRGDILANHAALIVLALNWFNPIAWFAFRAFRADQELSCDAAIAAAAPAGIRGAYASALVKSASPSGFVSACPLNEADQLKRRLKMLNRHRRGAARRWTGAAMVGSLAAATLLSGAPGFAQPSQTPAAGDGQPRREQIFIMDQRGAGEAAPAQGERREIRVRRNADGTSAIEGLPAEVGGRMRDCRDGTQLVDVNAGSDNDRTRILLCTRGEASAEQRGETLRRAREQIAGNADMSAETKQRILAELDRAIAGARAN